MDPQMRFRINRPEVVCESFDGEVVAIHFASGNYYSLAGVAADILELLDDGYTVSEASESLARLYDGESHDIGGAVRNFVDELQQENLIVARESADVARGTGRKMSAESQGAAEKVAFEPPRLEKYSDMQDLLLLDPIHDVDEIGWPSVLPETRAADQR